MIEPTGERQRTRQLPASPPARALLAALCLGLSCASATVLAQVPTLATSSIGAAQVDCAVAGATLNFGNLDPRTRNAYPGVGEITVVCTNHSRAVRSATLTLALATMEAQGFRLQGRQEALAISFYRDALFTDRWGDDRNGATAMRISVEVMPGEQRRLRIPVHARLQAARESTAGTYNAQFPIVLDVQ